MRSVLPGALLTFILTSTSVLAQSSVEDLVQDLLPECVHSCATDVLESFTDCNLDDTACFCNSDVTTIEVLTEWGQCGVNCDADEIEALMIGPEDVHNQFRGICDGVDTDSDDESANNSDSGDDTSNDSSSQDDDSSDTTAEGEASENIASSLVPGNSVLAVGMMIIAAVL